MVTGYGGACVCQVGNGCGYRVRGVSPTGAEAREDEPAPQPPELQPHFTLPPPTLPYDDYRYAHSLTVATA